MTYTHRFKKSFKFHDQEYKEIEFDFEGLTGNDYIAAERQFGERYENKVTPLLELNKEYQTIIASKAAKLPLELFFALPVRDLSKITIQVQNFLLKSDSEEEEETTDTSPLPEQAGGMTAHAEGFETNASGSSPHAEGSNTTASGSNSHAEGLRAEASGQSSHAEGYYTTAGVLASHAQGRYNNPLQGSATSMLTTDDAHVIGNGTSDTNKGNAFRVTFDGRVFALSAFNSTGADYAEFFEWEDGNPENEDRVGYFVTLDGEKIKKATSNDYILGIISANPSVIGDSHNDDWHDKYIRDEWGRIQYHWIDMPKEDNEDEDVDGEEIEDNENVEEAEVENDENKVETEEEIEEVEKAYVPILNPNWNNEEEYIKREDRPEWDTVGMLGKLRVRDDGTCEVNGYCTANDDGIATTSDNGYRVIKRISDNVVEVIFK